VYVAPGAELGSCANPVTVGRETGFNLAFQRQETAMTVLERAAQEVADAAAQPPFLFQLPFERTAELAGLPPATVLTAEAESLRNAFGTQP
jgi:hypothetical protein